MVPFVNYFRFLRLQRLRADAMGPKLLVAFVQALQIEFGTPLPSGCTTLMGRARWLGFSSSQAPKPTAHRGSLLRGSTLVKLFVGSAFNTP